MRIITIKQFTKTTFFLYYITLSINACHHIISNSEKIRCHASTLRLTSVAGVT